MRRLSRPFKQSVRSYSEPLGDSKNRSKTGALHPAFEITDEGAIQPGPHVQCHLRHPEFMPCGSHYFSKRLFHARARLNLLPTFGHLKKHRPLLSVVGQRAVTDILETEELRVEAA
jgi:hypothetical protein